MLFASKNPKLQTFKIHGHIPLRALLLKDGDDPSSFVIFGKFFKSLKIKIFFYVHKTFYK